MFLGNILLRPPERVLVVFFSAQRLIIILKLRSRPRGKNAFHIFVRNIQPSSEYSAQNNLRNHEIFKIFYDFTHFCYKKGTIFTFSGKYISFYQGFIRGFETFSKYAVLLYVFNGFPSDFLTETSSGQGAVAPEVFLRNISEVFCRKLFRKGLQIFFRLGSRGLWPDCMHRASGALIFQKHICVHHIIII